MASNPSPVDQERDDPFDYDHSLDAAFKTRNDKPGPATGGSKGKKGANLGIDEEIKVVKKRQPIAKLDEARLLSAAGIPRLRKISKDKPRFKGKGHEFSDMARLLNMYQLWLDDLYPRAKFADGLTIIEKLGHSKRLQVMRKAWIDEGKPKAAHSEDEVMDGLPDEGENARDINTRSPIPTQPNDIHQEETQDMGEPIQGDGGDGIPDDDELDALLAEDAPQLPAKGTTEAVTSVISVNDYDAPGDDDLDALLAEDDARRAEEGGKVHPISQNLKKLEIRNPADDEFADEMDIIAGMDDDDW